MQILMIGTGSIGRRHISNLQRLLPTRIDWVFLRHQHYQDDLSRSLQATVISDIDQVESQKIVFAVIATPSSMHIKNLLWLLAKQIPFYVEKPIVSNATQLSQLNAAIKKSPKIPVNQVGCHLRFLPAVQRLKKMIESGDLGNIVRASFQVGQWLPDWRPDQDYQQSYSASPELGGGVILDLIHEIDLAVYLLGELQLVDAVLSKPQVLDILSEGVAGVLLQQKNGPIVQLGLDYISRQLLRSYDIIGDLATARIDIVRQTIELWQFEMKNLPVVANWDFDVQVAYLNAMKHFLHCVHRGVDTKHGIKQGVMSMRLALEIRESAWKNHHEQMAVEP